MQFKKNMQLELQILSFGAQGEGIAKVDGFPIFVPLALPGERVRAQIVKAEKKYAFAKAIEILTPSHLRAAPPCPYYPQCGGCSCQHMQYAAQLDFKRNQVESCMRHIGGVDVEVQPVIGMDDPWHYRNKISMPVAPGKDGPAIGYYAQRSHRVISVDACRLSHDAADRVCETVRLWMRQQRVAAYDEETHTGLIRHVMTRMNRAGALMAVLVVNGERIPHGDALLKLLQQRVPEMISLCISSNTKRGNVILGEHYRVLWGESRLEDELCGNRFLISPLSFFQINPTQTEKLYQTAMTCAALTSRENVADLYCGAGTISLMLARQAKHVTGIEIVPDAIRDAKENARRNGVENVDFYCGEAERILPERISAGLRPDVIVLDPPRKGAEASVLRCIADCAPSRIVYVSCNPATQARDAKILSELGYTAEFCQPVDMFCQTAGVETVCLLSKIRSAPHIDIDLDMTELDVTAAETKATYEEIKAYVLEHTGLKVSCLYIAQVCWSGFFPPCGHVPALAFPLLLCI